VAWYNDNMDNINVGERRAIIAKRGKRKYWHIWLECPVCHKQRWVREDTLHASKEKNGICLPCKARQTGKSLTGEKNNFWKGGRHLTHQGYVRMWIAKDDFFYPMANGHGYILEHRLVMAQHLKRCLLPWEIVHHNNGIHDDNRIENLRLLPSQSHHVSDSILKQAIKRLENTIFAQQKIIQELKNKLGE